MIGFELVPNALQLDDREEAGCAEIEHHVGDLQQAVFQLAQVWRLQLAEGLEDAVHQGKAPLDDLLHHIGVGLDHFGVLPEADSFEELLQLRYESLSAFAQR